MRKLVFMGYMPLDGARRDVLDVLFLSVVARGTQWCWYSRERLY